MRSELTITWREIEHAEDYADALQAILQDLEWEFREIGYDTKATPYHRRRFGQEAPRHSEVGKSFEAEPPIWKIGYGDGHIILKFSPPNYRRHMVVNQSRLECLFRGDPREFEGMDTERQERATRVLAEGLFRVGLHPGGPTPPATWEWNLRP